MARLRVALAVVMVAVLTLRAGLGAGPAPAQEPQPPTFRSSVEAVQVSVIVTDASGTPVAGLTKDDFEIVEAREPRPITTFSAVNIPLVTNEPGALARDVIGNDGPPGRVYIIVFDDMDATLALRARVFLREFIEHHFGPNDNAAVVLTTRGPRESGQEFTSNPALLLRAIDGFTGGSVGGGWAREKNFVGDFKALVKVLTTLPAARKAMILVSTNIPADADKLRNARMGRISRIFTDVNPEFYDAVSMATRNNIVVYPIDPSGLTTELSAPGSFDTSAMEARGTLQSLAEMTGGFALTNSNGYAAAFERMVRENSTYYVLGFNAGDERRNGFTPVEVRVKRPGLTVRSIDGYLAPSEKSDPVRRPKTVLAAAWDAVASPLTAGGVNMRMFAAPYKVGGKTSMVEITLEVATDRLRLVEQDGLYRGELEILFAITDSKNHRFPVRRHRATLALKPETYERVSRTALRVQSQLPLTKGKYQVRASAGGEMVAGSVVYDVEVPDFNDDFALSGLALTSAQARETVTVSPDKHIDVEFPGPPTTAREFAREDSLTLFIEAYENRKKKHTVAFEIALRDESGKVLDMLQTEHASDEKPQEPTVHTFAPTFSLADIPPGHYTVQVQARSSLSRQPLVRAISFTVR